MGLGFFGAKAHWSYSGFNDFRGKLAREIGICLPLMEGFWVPGDTRYSKIELAKKIIGPEMFEGNLFWLPSEPMKWDNIKDPIVDLLYHSDCEGYLTVSQCKKIAPRLRYLVKDWSDYDYDKEQALLLAEGMDKCIKEKSKLIFC